MLSNGLFLVLVPRIESHPTGCQYSLINYLGFKRVCTERTFERFQWLVGQNIADSVHC